MGACSALPGLATIPADCALSTASRHAPGAPRDMPPHRLRTCLSSALPTRPANISRLLAIRDPFASPQGVTGTLDANKINEYSILAVFWLLTDRGGTPAAQGMVSRQRVWIALAPWAAAWMRTCGRVFDSLPRARPFGPLTRWLSTWLLVACLLACPLPSLASTFLSTHTF